MAVVPKTMELGCQASSMECKVLAADVDLTSSVNYNRSVSYTHLTLPTRSTV